MFTLKQRMNLVSMMMIADALINDETYEQMKQRRKQQHKPYQQYHQQQQHQQERKEQVMNDEEDSNENEIDSAVMDVIWILLCSSILSVMESIPKCNLSPNNYREITSPPLKTGSPFRVLLRLLLSSLERNMSLKTNRFDKNINSNALQYLTWNNIHR